MESMRVGGIVFGEGSLCDYYFTRQQRFHRAAAIDAATPIRFALHLGPLFKGPNGTVQRGESWS